MTALAKHAPIMMLVASVFSLPLGAYTGGAPKTWPAVAPLQRTFYFPDAGQATLSLQLLGRDGRALYRLECHTWRYDQDPDFDYSGDFECRLTSTYAKETYSTLLTDNPNPDLLT